jgi:WD40 repeat protein
MTVIGGSGGGVSLAADGKTFALEEANGGQVHVLDLEAAAEIATLERTDPNSFFYTALAISPDDKTVAAADDTSSNIQLWDVESGEATFTLTGHHPNDTGSLGVYGLAFCPDGTLLASASYDQTVRIWDVATGTELVSLPTSDELGAAVVAWSPDGSVLASANLDGSIQLWGVK